MSVADAEAEVVELDTGGAQHLLLVPADVTPEELEALAVSRSTDAGWLPDGRLRLCAGAALSGPVDVPEDVRRAFDLPRWARTGYLLDAPRQRSRPLPPELRGVDDYLDAFPDGVPEGVEAQALDHLRAMARRLAGAVRVAGTGAVLLGDPESAVDLTVLSEVWLAPEACLQVLRPVMPQVRSLLDVDLGEPPPRDRLALDGTGPRAAAVQGLDPDERAWLHAEADAFDAAALEAEPVLTDYALLDTGPDAVEIAVVGAETVPVVLRDTDWARGGVVRYEIRWRPHDAETALVRRPPLAVRRRRAAVAARIEAAALALHAAVGGEICDDDGFLVDPESLARPDA